MSLSKKIRVVAALGTLSGAVWAGTFAAFSDTGTATATFSAGTVVLELNDDGTSPYSFTSLSTANMKPGQETYATLKVENAGNLASTYTMASTESEAVLSGALELGAVVGAVTCNAGGYSTAALTPTNVVIANGSLSAAEIATPRALAAGGSETLCVKVTLPSGAANSLQGVSTTSSFAFTLTNS